MSETKEKLMLILAKCADKDVSEIEPSMEPAHDLEFDSIRLLDFIIEIEDAFHIDFNDFSKVSLHMSTVEELIEFICEVIDGGSSRDE